MTIKNFTFFSPNGTEFPVGSNNDGKLYMMLTGMDYNTLRRKDWSDPIHTALNIQYVNTSLVVGGRYFELVGETVALKANTQNYIHANIDLTQTANPVSISAEDSDNSNGIDLNNDSGVLKIVIDIVGTNGQGVVGTEAPENITYLDKLVVKHASNGFGQLSASKLEADWNIQEVGGGIYRFSRIINVTQAVSSPWGAIYISPEIGVPALPAGYSRNYITAVMSNTNNLMWCAITSPNGFRLMSGQNTAGATRQVLVEAFATKNP